MKHTPAPWKMIDRMDNRHKPCGIGISGTVESDKYHGTESVIVCSLPDGATVNGGKAFEMQYHNAKLIAAAPELLEACQNFIEYFKNVEYRPGILHDVFYMVQDAVKKATGE